MPTDRIRAVAVFSVKRGCGFALLAIATAMVGCSYDLLLCARLGATLFTLTGAILLLMASRAMAKSYRRTELWVLLGKRHDLPEARAQTIIGGIRREVLLQHAQYAASVAALLWLFAGVLWVSGHVTVR